MIPASINHIVRRVQNAALMEEIAACVVGELIVGSSGHYSDLKAANRVGGKNATCRAGRKDIRSLIIDHARLYRRRSKFGNDLPHSSMVHIADDQLRAPRRQHPG